MALGLNYGAFVFLANVERSLGNIEESIAFGGKYQTTRIHSRNALYFHKHTHRKTRQNQQNQLYDDIKQIL